MADDSDGGVGADTTVHGIPSCDTVRKARRWLDEHGVGYAFHDYKKAGIDAAKLEAWSAKVGWDQLLNRRGTTYRQLDESERDGIDEARAIRLMGERPSLIVRPVIEHGDEVIVGFDDTLYTKLFGL